MQYRDGHGYPKWRTSLGKPNRLPSLFAVLTLCEKNPSDVEYKKRRIWSETERKRGWGGGNGIRSDLGMEIRRFDTALNSFKRPRLMDRYRTKRRYHVTNIRQPLYFITLYTYYVLSGNPFVVSPEISAKPFFACLIDHYAYVIFRVSRYGIEIDREKIYRSNDTR